MGEVTVLRGSRGLLKGLTEGDIQAILDARRRHVSYAKLSRIYGFHQGTIRYAVLKLDAALLEKTSPRRPLYALNDNERASIVQARRNGASYSALARQYGYGPNTIRHAVRLIAPDVYLETKRQ